MGEQAKYEELLPKVALHFPQITQQDLAAEVPKGQYKGKNEWTMLVKRVRTKLSRKEESLTRRGIWRITAKGRNRLRKEGLLKVELESPLIEPEKLARKIDEKPSQLTHDELIQKTKEIGEMLGKLAEVKCGPKFEHDCVWKDSSFASPKLVIEVCDKGNLYKDIVSLDWAVTTWGAKGTWVIFDDSDFHKGKEMLAQKSQVYPIEAEDILKLHSLLQSGYAHAIRTILAT